MICLNWSALNPVIASEKFAELVGIAIVFLPGVGAGVEPTDPVGEGASGDTGWGTYWDSCLDNATASTRASPPSLTGWSISWSAIVSSGAAVMTQPNVMGLYTYVVQKATRVYIRK